MQLQKHQIPGAFLSCATEILYHLLWTHLPFFTNFTTFSITCAALVTELLEVCFCVLVVEWLESNLTLMWWAVLTCNLTEEDCGGVQM